MNGWPVRRSFVSHGLSHRSRRRRIYVWFRIGQDNPLPFQLCSAEVEDEPDWQSSYSQVIDHSTSFVIGNPIDNFRLNDNRIVCDQIRNILTDFSPFVDNVEASLLLTRHSAQSDPNRESVLIRLFMESVSELLRHLQSGRSQ